MNIFDIYLDKIIKIVTDQNKKGLLKLPGTLDSINVDIPPNKFDCDISTNVAMVLAKINETQPLELANKLIPLIRNEDSNIANIEFAKPGFINIKFKNIEKEIRFFLKQKMYNNKSVLIKNNRGKMIVKKLYSLIHKNPYKFLNKEQLKKNKTRTIADFISGMTDRYAINLYNNSK